MSCKKDPNDQEGDGSIPGTPTTENGEPKTCEADICEDNKANIRIRVSSTDEYVKHDEKSFLEPTKSNNCCKADVLGSNQEKRAIKLQRSDAQDDDASIDVDIDSVTRNMSSLTASGQTTSNGVDRKKNLLSSQGSGGSNDTSSPCLSRDSSTELYTDSTGIDLEKFITDSLQSKDRLFLLGIEKDIMSFVKDDERASHQFDKMNTYHRMLVHRVAAFFGLDHNVDKATESVVVTKTKNTRLPDLKFDDVQASRIGCEVSYEPKKLLKRSDGAGSSIEKSPDRRDLRGNKSQSYEERHEKYVETRARIFAASHSSGSEEQSNTGDNSLGATANSSQSDVSRGQDKPWSSVDSDSSGKVIKDRNSLHPPVIVKKSRSLEGPVNTGLATNKVPLQQTKANSWNESSSRGAACDAVSCRSVEWPRSSFTSHHHQNRNPRNPNWYPRGDVPQRNHNHRFRGPHQPNWVVNDPSRAVLVGSNSNQRFHDQAGQYGDHMVLHQVASILGQSDQLHMQNPGVFYQQVPMPPVPIQVQQPVHPKNSAAQQHSVCNGAPTSSIGQPWQDVSHNNPNVRDNYNQQVFCGTVDATIQGPPSQHDPRYLYLNPQYSVQSPFGGQNYLLMASSGGGQGPSGLRATNFSPNYPGQSMMQPPAMTQGSPSMTFLPQPHPTVTNGATSNGQGLLPLPYPFQNQTQLQQQAPHDFQSLPRQVRFILPPPQLIQLKQMSTGCNTMFKTMNPHQPQNLTQPLVLTNQAPGMPIASRQGSFLPGLIVSNPQMNDRNQRHQQQNAFYGQVCPTVPTRFRHPSSRGHIGHRWMEG